MARFRLIIGNRNYSSWSLRAWLALRRTGAAFDELRLPLDTPQFEARIGELSPTRRVPVLWDGQFCVWDSLAIGEYLAEQFPEAGLLPHDSQGRARVRSVCAEMHGGFDALRSSLPMNIRALGRRVPVTPALQADISRINAIWRNAREAAAQQGPWLFGDFTLADAMYAPVAMRYRTYDVECGDTERAYVRTVAGSELLQPWIAAAEAEPERIEQEELGET